MGFWVGNIGYITAKIIALFKNEDRSEPDNYRPVSLTSQVCKVMETIVRGHLVDHLMKNDLVSDQQLGFTQGRSCLTNLLEVLEEWTNILNDGDSVDVST